MAAVHLLYSLLSIYQYVILARVLLSWFPHAQEYRLSQILAQLADPYLNLFRGWIPPIADTIDLSPILAILLLNWVKNALLLL